MTDWTSVGPPPSRRAIRILCAAVLLSQPLAMALSWIPAYFLVSTLGSPLFVPIWIVCLALILLFQGTAAALATLAVRHFAADARSFSAWHVSRSAMSGLFAGFALLLAADRWTGSPANELVLGLALLALPAGVVLGTLRGTRYHSAL